MRRITQYTGCLDNYYQVEMYSTKFDGSNHNTHLSFFAYAKNPFDTIITENVLSIGIIIPLDSIYSFCGFYCFKEDTLLNYPNVIVGGYIEDFYDSIAINGRIYHNIYRLIGEFANPQYEKIDEILYSISEGIIEFTTNKGNVWYLKKDLHWA